VSGEALAIARLKARCSSLSKVIADLTAKLSVAERALAERDAQPGLSVDRTEWARLVEVDRMAEEYVAQADKRCEVLRRIVRTRNEEIASLKEQLRGAGVAVEQDGPLTD
jgi:ActR/RegA family two-component response regulator